MKSASSRSSSTAHPSRIRHRPGITANSLEGIEERRRIPFALDSKQRGVVASEEGLLPVRLTEISLILVAAAVRSDSLERRHIFSGNLLLVRNHLGPRRGLVPRQAELHRHGCVAQGWEDCVGDVDWVGDVHADSDGDQAALGQGAQCVAHPVVVLLEGAAGNQTSAVLVGAHVEVAPRKRTHVRVVVVIVLRRFLPTSWYGLIEFGIIIALNFIL